MSLVRTVPDDPGEAGFEIQTLYTLMRSVSGYTRTYWTLKFTGDCYFCGFSQPLTVIACVFLSIVVIAATCCVCCRTDPSRQLSTMHQAMQQQMQKIVNSRCVRVGIFGTTMDIQMTYFSLKAIYDY